MKFKLTVVVLILLIVAMLMLRTRDRRAPAPQSSPPAVGLAVHLLPLLASASIDSVLDHADRLPPEAAAVVMFSEEFADPQLAAWQRFREPRASSTQSSFTLGTGTDGNPQLECAHHGESLYRFVPVAPGTMVQLSARVRGRAPVFAVEYKNPRVGDSLERLQKARPVNQVVLDDAASVPADMFREVSKTWLLSSKTRLLAIGIVGKEGADEGNSILRSVKLARASGRDFLEHMRDAYPMGDGGNAARTAWLKRIDLGGRRADALFVPPPTRIDLALDAPLRGKLLRSAIALATGATPQDVGAKITFATYRGAEQLTHAERTVAVRDFSFGAAWVDFSLDVPDQAERLVIETLPTSVSGHRDSLALYLVDPVLVPRTRQSDAPNVVLISIDTLRRDHVSCYGYARPTSPNLDAFAAQGALFDSCIAQCSYTLPSHVSMLSGQYPIVHGVQVVDDHIVASKTPLLSEILHAAGYRTAGFAGGLLVHSSYGYERGFDAYADRDPLMNTQGDQAIGRYLEQSVNAPFFLFVHTYGVHDFFASDETVARFHPEPCASRLHGKPYLDWGVVSVADGYGEADRRHLVDLYDAAIADTDAFVGGILNRIRALGLEQNTIVIITSDHGKELLDRGTFSHGHSLYDEMIRVPLMMRGPGIKPQRTGSLVELVDITPTVVELARLTAHDGMQGTSLVSLMRGAGDAKLTTLSELMATTHKFAWRTKFDKLIESAPRAGVQGETVIELYDLLADPGERHALPALGERAKVMGAQLHRVRSVLNERARELGSGRAEKTDFNEDLEELLRQQGYIGTDRGTPPRK